jgi:hypothetical protein
MTDTAIETETTRDCPFCGEQILAKARKCKHCSEFLDANERLSASGARHAPHVYMNAGGAAVAPQMALRPWGHGIHILLSILTLGLWVPIWIILYLVRNKAIYY